MTPEELGKLVREVWIAWAHEQAHPKPSWLTPWEELSEPEREVDRRIGVAIAQAEREACAQLCATYDIIWENREFKLEKRTRAQTTYGDVYATAIRKRGESTS